MYERQRDTKRDVSEEREREEGTLTQVCKTERDKERCLRREREREVRQHKQHTYDTYAHAHSRRIIVCSSSG